MALAAYFCSIFVLAAFTLLNLLRLTSFFLISVELVLPSLGLVISRSMRIGFAFFAGLGLIAWSVVVIMVVLTEFGLRKVLKDLNLSPPIMDSLPAFVPSWMESVAHFASSYSNFLLALVSSKAFS
jgi:hypothetical protein